MSSVPSIGYWCSIAAQHYYGRLQRKLEHLAIDQWFVVLVTIHESGGKLSQQELADALHLDKVAMTRALDHLDEGGYIERCDCTSDRRKHLIRSTAKADGAVKDIRKAYRELNKEALKGMKATDRDLFQTQLSRMATNLRPERSKAGSTAKRVKA